jgi:membrane protease YdiL (CAAX protease family)
LVFGFGIGLVFMGALRFSAFNPTVLTPLSGFATPGYVIVTVVFVIALTRVGVPFRRFGFDARPGIRHAMLALAAVAVIRLFNTAVGSLLEELLNSPRNLERFSAVEGSIGSLVAVLVLSWTFAAFGEEFTYRIVLMRAVAFALGDSRRAVVLAVMLQAIVFGLAHTYQGAAGIVGSALNGLVFGTVTVVARWSIWPAALAHGANNTIGLLALYFAD